MLDTCRYEYSNNLKGAVVIYVFYFSLNLGCLLFLSFSNTSQNFVDVCWIKHIGNYGLLNSKDRFSHPGKENLLMNYLIKTPLLFSQV